MKKSWAACLLTLLIPVASSALVNQAYVGIMGGMTYVQGLDARYNNNTETHSIKFKAGQDVAAMFGTQSGSTRYELELLSANAQAKDGSHAGSGESKLKLTSVLANVYFFPNIGPQYFIQPYFGLGAGVASIKLPTVQPQNTAVDSSTRSTLDYQAIAGLDWVVRDNINLMFDYRFMGTLRANYYNDAGVTGRENIFINSLNIGLQYRFDV